MMNKKLMLLLVLSLLFAGLMASSVSAGPIEDLGKLLDSAGTAFSSNPDVWVPVAAFLVIAMFVSIVAISLGLSKGLSAALGAGLGIVTALIIPKEIWVVLATSYAGLVLSIMAILPFAGLAWFTFDIVRKSRSRVLFISTIIGWVMFLFIMTYLFSAFETLSGAKAIIPTWTETLRLLLYLGGIAAIIVLGYLTFKGGKAPAAAAGGKLAEWIKKARDEAMMLDAEISEGISLLEQAVGKMELKQSNGLIDKAVKKFETAYALDQDIKGKIRKIEDSDEKTKATGLWSGIRTSLKNVAIRESKECKNKKAELGERDAPLKVVIDKLEGDDGAKKLADGLVVLLK